MVSYYLILNLSLFGYPECRKHIRDDTGHDALIVTKEEHPQTHKHRRKIPIPINITLPISTIERTKTHNNGFPVSP